MKSLYLLILILPLSLFSQSPRLVLFEEFTQASCGPCADMNPELNRILNKYPDKVVSIKYQTYFPGYDPMNQHNPVDVDYRYDYYNATGVPLGKLDGGIAFSGIPDNFDSSDVINRQMVSSPFTIDVSYQISPTNDTMYCSALITCTQPVTGNLAAHVAIIERDIYFFDTPGANDETHFEGVMKKMLPNGTGTMLQSSWSNGDTMQLNYSWPLANVYDINQLACVVFIQDTTTKEVLQAGYKPPDIAADIRIKEITNVPELQCTPDISPVVALRNCGYNSVTTFEIHYILNGQLQQIFNWNGLLLPYHDTIYQLPVLSPGDGGHFIELHAKNPNGQHDIITLNDSALASTVIYTVNILPPFHEDFSSGSISSSGIGPLNPNNDFHYWQYSTIGNGNPGSILMNVFDTEDFGTYDYFFLPKLDLTSVTGPVDLTFDVAYAPYSASLSDELTISVSDDCGLTWTDIYNKAGTVLATSPATMSAFVPVANQWRTDSVPLNTFAGQNDFLLRFELYGRRGNNIYIDNISLNGNTVNVMENELSAAINLFPQPASEFVRVSGTELMHDILVQVYNSSGELIYSSERKNIDDLRIDVSPFVSGLYYIKIVSEEKEYSKKFTIVR